MLDLSQRRFEAIPTVDLRAPAQELVAALAAACEYPGFFYLVGLPDSVEQSASVALDAARTFFRLPMAEKMKLQNTPELQYHVRDSNGHIHCVPGSGNGYRPPGQDVHFSKDQRESFNVGRESFEQDEDPPYATVWPDQSVLPGWCSLIKQHQEQMLAVSARLRRLLALALGAPENLFDSPGMFDRGTHQTGMVYYHPTQSNTDRAVFGIRPHVDEGMFTLLVNDGEAGLHICPGKERVATKQVWVPVPPKAGALVVNLGSELERWSNGRFKATLHCVINETGRERFSLPFFYETNLYADVEPLPCAILPGTAPLFGRSSPAERMLADLGLHPGDLKDQVVGQTHYGTSRVAGSQTEHPSKL